jgi:YD repeat-containing protein
VAGRLGAGWRDSFERSLHRATSATQYPPDTVTVWRPDGRIVQFQQQGGAWLSDGDVQDQLSELTSNGTTTGWQLRLAADDSLEEYDAEGKLISIATRARQRVTLSYSDATSPASIAPISGLLLAVQDDFGHRLAFTYDGAARLVQMTDPDGKAYGYAYDANGNLASVTYPDGSTRSYVYENSSLTNALTGIVDENGTRFANFAYDAQGRATLTEHAGGVERHTFAYGSLQTTVTDPLGTARLYTFQNVQYGLSSSGMS